MLRESSFLNCGIDWADYPAASAAQIFYELLEEYKASFLLSHIPNLIDIMLMSFPLEPWCGPFHHPSSSKSPKDIRKGWNFSTSWSWCFPRKCCRRYGHRRVVAHSWVQHRTLSMKTTTHLLDNAHFGTTLSSSNLSLSRQWNPICKVLETKTHANFLGAHISHTTAHNVHNSYHGAPIDFNMTSWSCCLLGTSRQMEPGMAGSFRTPHLSNPM